ncbi:flagellar assembly peptidoglycan hydrolase FlgJ [Thioalkalivibrio sp. XN279]|uniref:flagellar assembly peptidoglycan hydrolase FlgJ n=1 Tax=Thioalkalivibrio sp. XN279 TaxID=2714953 RepID=UPI00140CB4B5|nr:flagellar assembly peptidoglycan hydrolase FlgJ [Thioalkalivibrio sp. XN279]NHA13379.1 flagellar assembly peptidoglycan hydrolase FlgJ [Thioalkalivibrio sp. XN279]
MSFPDAPHLSGPVGSGDLSGLRRAARAGDADAAKAAAQQFEALFVQMMVKQMREAMPTEGGLFGGEGMKLYEGLHDQQLSLSMAQRGGIGLAAAIERQLLQGGAPTSPMPGPRPLNFPTHRLPARPQALVDMTPAGPAAAAGSTGPSAAAAAGAADAPGPVARRDDIAPAEFVRRLWPHAQRAAARLGIAPEVLVAQSALETGWGRHMIRHADGRSSHNLFGIKASGNWQGERVGVPTLEYRDGVARREHAAFRGYRDEAASFADYARLIGSEPRYQKALASGGDPAVYLRGLQEAGYATDPAYADKILAILERGLPGLPSSPAFNSAATRPTTMETGRPGMAYVRPQAAGEEST